jgi:hypothetical protein
MPSEKDKLRVVKKLSPSSRGALKLAQHYGDALVCVRHRTDDKGEIRYTTVELLVETSEIRPRIDKIVGVRIAQNERSLQSLVKAAGASWDSNKKLWRIPRRIAGILRIGDRIVEK